MRAMWVFGTLPGEIDRIWHHVCAQVAMNARANRIAFRFARSLWEWVEVAEF
jgi:hypothetical protein